MSHGKGLVTFTLFGNDPMYTVGALRNVAIWQDSPLDVDCRFYVGTSVNEQIKRQLTYEGADVVWVGRKPETQEATFWRYEAFKDRNEEYDYILSRDVDSRPFDREFYAIDEWLNTGKAFHIIRDHPFHGVPILAGLFGVKKRAYQLMSEILPSKIPWDFYGRINRACNHIAVNYESNDFYQVDQWWLRLNVYPKWRMDVVAHDEYFGWERKRFKLKFPPRDEDNRFCGEGFDEFDRPRYPEHRNMFNQWPRRTIPRKRKI